MPLISLGCVEPPPKEKKEKKAKGGKLEDAKTKSDAKSRRTEEPSDAQTKGTKTKGVGKIQDKSDTKTDDEELAESPASAKDPLSLKKIFKYVYCRDLMADYVGQMDPFQPDWLEGAETQTRRVASVACKLRVRLQSILSNELELRTAIMREEALELCTNPYMDAMVEAMGIVYVGATLHFIERREASERLPYHSQYPDQEKISPTRHSLSLDLRRLPLPLRNLAGIVNLSINKRRLKHINPSSTTIELEGKLRAHSNAMLGFALLDIYVTVEKAAMLALKDPSLSRDERGRHQDALIQYGETFQKVAKEQRAIHKDFALHTLLPPGPESPESRRESPEVSPESPSRSL